jgi:hypothetical protein
MNVSVQSSRSVLSPVRTISGNSSPRKRQHSRWSSRRESGRYVVCLALWAVLLVWLLPAAAFGFTVELRYGWNPGDLELRTINSFDYLGVSGSTYPITSLGSNWEIRLLPPGYEVVGYEIEHEDWEELSGDFRPGVVSSVGMTEMSGDDGGGLLSLKSGVFMGYSVLTAEVQPVRISDGRTSILKDLRVSVECRAGDVETRPVRRSRLMDEHVRGMVQDFLKQDVVGYGTWEVQAHRDWITEGPSLDGGVVDCVIVTPDSLSDEFERLADWHDRLGIRTVVRTVEWVKDNYAGGDGAERVRNFIKDAYVNWGTVYVVLGGDPRIVPMRIIDVPGMRDHVGRTEMPTDVYYTGLNGNWNANGNDLIGEYDLGVDDGIDFLSDVFVGRALVISRVEARTFIDKTIKYTKPANAGSWQRTAVSLAQQLFEHMDAAPWSEAILEHFPPTYRKIRLYENYDEYPGSLKENLANTVAYIDSGCNIVSHIGHGDELRLDLGTEFMERFQIEALRNDTAYCFVYMMNCSSSDPRVESVAKAFTKDPDGGAFAVVGNSSLAFPGTGLPMEKDFFELIFSEGRPTIGAVSAFYRERYAPNDPRAPQRLWMFLNYILIGDPVVRLWRDESRLPEVVAAGQMSPGDSVFAVEVRDDGVGVEGAVVVLMGERGEYGVGLTDGDGMAYVNYRPRGLGWVDLVVSGAGFGAYEGSVEVVGSGGRLYVSSVSIDDGTGWVGNDDGEAGWGERVGLGVGLVNGGVGSLSDVACSLRVVEGCSLWVSVQIDTIVSDSVVYVGRGCMHPGSVPFGLSVVGEVFGRCLGTWDEDVGCWLWLDGMGWHVRFIGDGEAHSYACSLSVFGELLGYSGNMVEPGDSVIRVGDMLVFGGGLGIGDFEDGLDLVLGSDGSVEVYDGSASYGSVGSSEVLGWYDVGFGLDGVGDGLGVWFELAMSEGGGGSWRDWFRLEVGDGEVFGERLEFVGLGGDTTGVRYGLRNVGGGGLKGLEGTLRGLSGVEVTDSVSVYGDLCSGCYGEGELYRVRELGGSVRYEFVVRDTYGREWVDTVDVRDVGVAGAISYRLGSDYIELSWASSSDSLLRGYDIYRGASYGGSYELVGMVEGYSRFVDEVLLSEEDYYYYICTRDSMGNVSAPSETAEVWTGAPYMPGWPAGPTNVIPSSVTLADVDRDNDLEIIIGSKDERVYVYHHDGILADGWPRETGAEIWATAAAMNLDGDPELEIVIGNDNGVIYAWNPDGSGVRLSDGYFRPVGGTVKGAPVGDDLDGDLDMEIVAASGNGQMFVWHHDGTGYLQSNGYFAKAIGGVQGSPAIADLDNDEELEIIVGSMGTNIYAWNADGTGYLESTGVFAQCSAAFGSVALGDVDGNGDLEVVACALYSRSIKVYDHDGSAHLGWPKSVDCNVYASPALADLDGDGKLDIIVGTNRGSQDDTASVYVYNDKGAIRAGWPQRFEADFYSSPVVGDISGDGIPDILVASTDGNIYVWHDDGTPVKGWPRFLIYEFYATPALGDLDNDDDLDVVAAGYDAQIHVFDCSAYCSDSTLEWPQLCHDRLNSGLYGGPSKSGIGPGGNDGLPAKVMLAGYPNPAFSAVNIRLGIPSARSADMLSVDVYDVLGRHLKQVHSGKLEPGFHEFRWDGTNKSDATVSSGIYFVRASWRRDSISRKIVLVR